MRVVKYIFKILLTFIIISGMLCLFFVFTLPALQQPREQLVEQEMDVHNQTLELIKQDFSHVLSAENVGVEIGENIKLGISGKYCILNVELNRELKVLTLETYDKTQDTLGGLTLACIGEGIATIFAIAWLCCIIGNIAKDISIARDRRKSRKKEVDVNVVV